MTQNMERGDRKLGWKLALGIALLPPVFSWFTLRNGYSRRTRFGAFAWCAIAALPLVGAAGILLSMGKFALTAGSSDSQVAGTPLEPFPGDGQWTLERVLDRHPVVAMGQEFTLGSLVFVITDAVVVERLGDERASMDPGPGGVFVVVSYAVRNTGGERVGVRPGDFRMYDGSGEVYSSSGDAKRVLIAIGRTPGYPENEIASGGHLLEALAFDVPRDSARTGLNLVVLENGGEREAVMIGLRQGQTDR